MFFAILKKMYYPNLILPILADDQVSAGRLSAARTTGSEGPLYQR